MPADLTDFNREIECVYKGEKYSVRDNGAVLRHSREGKRIRPADNIWTFGKLNTETGYLEIASIRIHRIIATAFHGEPPTKEHIVDHIDTNKQNNRPENLRWVTRLENILLNTITAKRIAIVCGSVEAFLDAPAKFRDRFQEPNLKWMQTVSLEEAHLSKERLLTWAKSDKPTSGMTLDDWIFRTDRTSYLMQEPLEYVKAETPNAIQKNWTTPSVFPCCPIEISETPIYSYANNLKIGETFSRNKYSNWLIADYALSEDGNKLCVMCSAADPNAVKRWSVAQVIFEDNLFVHESLGSFFKKDGAEKHFTLAQGLDWTGGDTFDDLV